jgi:hypothetical protein
MTKDTLQQLQKTESKRLILRPFIRFGYVNYLRQHRYLRELAAAVIFTIFFGGFLSGPQLEDGIWWVFAVFALILNLLTTPSIFYMDSGNTLYFLLVQPMGRKRFYLSKVILIVLIDLVWVGGFALVYGLRFLQPDYFLLLPVRMMILALLLLLSTLLLSFSFTRHPQWSWLIFVLLIFGNIVNKGKLLQIESWSEVVNLVVVLLPPMFEISQVAVSLQFTAESLGFLALALVQIWLLYWWNRKLLYRKDIF